MFRQISFTSLPAPDLDRAIAFYTGPLGLSVHTDFPGPFGRWVMLAIPGAETLIHLDDSDAAPPPGPAPRPALVLIAPDLTAAHAALVAAGADVTAPPGPSEWDPEMQRMMFKDSEGNLILATSPLA